jgi:hypothetical protein
MSPVDVHLTQSQLEAWAIGALEEREALAVEAHATACAACGSLLEKEARLEGALAELAQARPLPEPLVFPEFKAWQRVALVSLGAALAAGLAFGLSLWPPPPREAPAPHCADEACVERANYDGLLTVGPGATVEIPRYEQVLEAPR